MEILAPANNSIRLIRKIIAAGADAVYFGVRPIHSRQHRYSLLWTPFEFDFPSAAHAIKIIAEAGRRSYVTMNVFYPEAQMEGALELSCRLNDAGASAFIVADPGFAARLKFLRPGVELHVSIVGKVFNSEAAIFWKGIGASRVILERTMCLDEVSSIKRESGLDVELFIYGNFCFFYHGFCRASSYFFGEQCIGPCQEAYAIESLDTPSKPFRSKPLNGYGALKEIFDAGVSAIKIEGRQKSARYILGAVRSFRQALDALADGLPLPPAPGSNFSFPSPPTATQGFFLAPPHVEDTLDGLDGFSDLARQLYVYLTPNGFQVARQMRRARKRAYRDARRLSDS